MTGGQRRAHLAFWVVVGPLMLAALAWALIDRPAVAPSEPPPAAVSSVSPVVAE